jgi:hypothetical protein
MRALYRLALASLVVALATAGPATANQARPMLGELHLTFSPAAEQRCGADALTLGFSGSGLVTHLGRVTGVGSNCTELALATDAVDIWDGLATYVAADGSSIQTTYEGTQDPPAAGTAVAVTVHTVTGGTGRFANANGQWTVTGSVNFATGTFVGELAGWLSH